MITYFKFKDMIDIAYHSNNDCLYLSLSDDYLQNNSPFKNSKDYMLKFTKLMIDNSDNIGDEYDIIFALYLMCKNPNFATLADAGFKFINMTGEN